MGRREKIAIDLISRRTFEAIGGAEIGMVLHKSSRTSWKAKGGKEIRVPIHIRGLPLIPAIIEGQVELVKNEVQNEVLIELLQLPLKDTGKLRVKLVIGSQVSYFTVGRASSSDYAQTPSSPVHPTKWDEPRAKLQYRDRKIEQYEFDPHLKASRDLWTVFDRAQEYRGRPLSVDKLLTEARAKAELTSPITRALKSVAKVLGEVPVIGAALSSCIESISDKPVDDTDKSAGLKAVEPRIIELASCENDLRDKLRISNDCFNARRSAKQGEYPVFNDVKLRFWNARYRFLFRRGSDTEALAIDLVSGLLWAAELSQEDADLWRCHLSVPCVRDYRRVTGSVNRLDLRVHDFREIHRNIIVGNEAPERVKPVDCVDPTVKKNLRG